MKKSLLALAVLTAVTGVASAQSSVTIYGKVDLGMVLDSGNANGKSVRISSGVSGGSRLGFKGVEDLGGGMKASFQLETGYCADSNAVTGSPGTVSATGTVSGNNFCTGGGFMGRQAHGDLTGAFGAVSAGRQYSLGYTTLTTIDPFGTGFAAQTDNIDATHGVYLMDPSNVRLNNSFQYTTPVMAGFTASGEIALGEQTGNWEAGRETGAAINYAQGPAFASFAFYDLTNSNGSGAALKNYLLGGTYDFGVVKVHALAEKTNGDPTGKPSLDILDLMGGVTVPFAGGSILASYINHNDRSSLDRDAHQIGIGYLYPLSKRTTLYSAFGHISNMNGAQFTNGNATEAGTGNKAFNLGVVHNF